MDAATVHRIPQYGFARGRCLPDVEYVTTGGVQKRLSDFKGRTNLVVILAGGDGDRLPAAMAAVDAEVRSHDGHIIAVLPTASPQASHWPFDIVVDSDGALHRKFGAGDTHGEPGLAVYITDRWGEVMFVCRTSEGDPP